MIYVLYLFIVCCIYQIVYQLALISVIIKQKKQKDKNPSLISSVSIVICAKNEEKNLRNNLDFIINQDYPDFEVILVDDGSDIPLSFDKERLTIIRISKEEKTGLGKKYALQKGIELAKNELILLTDADCRPVSRNWIQEMAACINTQYKIVLGISPYSSENTFLNSLIEYETAQTALQYAGFALSGEPYMSVGRNVMYDAALLKTKRWNREELSIASGDDDLSIQTLATAENTTVCLSKHAFTISAPEKSWSSWMKQKMRHYESGRLYKLSHRLFLGSYLLSKAIFYLGFLVLLIMKPAALWIILMLNYQIALMFINFALHMKTGLNKRWKFAFLYDILYCFFTLGLGLISQLKPNKNWN